ncbi:MAG: class A beta-lactamase-related serine hydrolase [Chloroflexi bacterium]|nr:class A beta-lactamase-related serine hydrolase [Chloroflexota bacterium]
MKLASLGFLSVAASPRLRRFPSICPLPPADSAVLSAEQQQRLIEASRIFIAPEIGAARQVALQIDFIEGPNEDASTMCGPLAVAILKTAGLLGAWVLPHDFWLVDPRNSLQPFQNTFPESLYTWQTFDTPIKEFDFARAPLQAGDLVYLHAAPGDTFEHVLVVNRVDGAGRAYTVTNFFVTTGTIIEERMLYDSQQPGVGQFADWGNRQLKNRFGNTGKGGFHVWRVKDGRSLEFPADENNTRLREQLDELLLTAAGDWYGAIKQIDGPLLYQFNPYASFHPASTIKVPVAMAFYQWLEEQAPSNWATYLNERGADGRSYASLLEAMLVNSEEEATESLVDSLGAAWLEETWQSWGLNATHIDPRRSSATEIIGLLEDLYSGKRLSAKSKEAILTLMSTYTSNDDTRIGLLRPELPRGSRIYNKRGSLVDWPRVVADSAIIELPTSAYLFSLHGIGRGQASYEELEATLDSAVQIFGDFLGAA